MDSKKDDKQGNGTPLLVNRRTFLKVAGAVATAAGAAPLLFKARKALAEPDPPDTDPSTVYIFSSCQMCHSRCGIKAKVQGGQLLKIDGNPYHPNNRGEDERVPFSTTPAASRTQFGRLCPKGQAGIQTLYDPYRIQHPLKRMGARGSGQWQTITWAQAFSEIGMQINTLIPFATRTANLDAMNVDLGHAANQLLFSPGRSIEKDISERVFKSGFGTSNFNLDHTSICEASHHVANKMMTKDHVVGTQGPNHFKTDMDKAEYMLVFGGNPVEANFPMLALARGNADMRDRARMGGPARVVIVDPRFSNSAAKADQWVPVKPGGDAALALGMGRVILEGTRYNAAYLKNANKPAATTGMEPTFTDATWLVIVQAGHANEGKFLTAAEAGIATPADAANPVCIRDTDGVAAEVQIRVPAMATPVAVVGRLEPTDMAVDYVTVNGIRCRTAFAVYKAAVYEHTLAEYATLSGIDAATITGLAMDFTSHGRKASAWTYRGVVQHTNGVYAQLAVMALNWLIGNVDYAGGLSKGGGSWDQKNATGGVDTMAVPGAVSPAGPRMDRAGSPYTMAQSYFRGYPATRPWFTFASEGVYQEIVPSIDNAYPYAAKVLVTYWNAWPYSVPGGKAVWERVVADTTKLPLLIAISPVIGEVAAWADYILPDTTYLEKWSFPGGNAVIPIKESPIQQPVVGAYDGVAIGGTGTWTFDPAATNEYTPLLPDTKMHADIMIGLAKAISATFPGVGTDALGMGRPLDRAWDFYRHQFNNLAINVGTNIGMTAYTVTDIIARGGAFALPGTAWDTANPNLMNAKYGGVLHFWVPQLATATNSVTGTKFRGVAYWVPPSHSDGTTVGDMMFPLQLITYKTVLHGQGRTNVNPWLMLLRPRNFVELSTTDAGVLGVETGDPVRIVSASNPTGVTGTAKVIEGLRPGVVAVSHHFGHWENGARSHMIGGAASEFDATRGAGLTANPVMRLDAHYTNVSLQDIVGGSVAFNDTWVRVERV